MIRKVDESNDFTVPKEPINKKLLSALLKEIKFTDEIVNVISGKNCLIVEALERYVELFDGTVESFRPEYKFAKHFLNTYEETEIKKGL